MAKFFYLSKLNRSEQESLLIQFCQAISKLNNPKEAAQFLKDLLSSQEAEMLARRLKIAELLIKRMSYAEISRDLKVSSGTIARVHEWLKVSGEGFRLVLERLEANKDNQERFESKDWNPLSWRNVKKRYPLYFWPQILLENIIKSANQKNRDKIVTTLKLMDKKSDLYKRLSGILEKRAVKL